MTTKLERQLAELATRLDVDAEPTLVADVLGRLEHPVRPAWHRQPRLLAAAALMLVLVAALIVPQSRHAVARFLGIGSTRIEPLPVTAPPATTEQSASPSSARPPSVVPPSSIAVTTQVPLTEATFPVELDLGADVDAAGAAEATGLAVPVAPGLGPPGGIFIDTAGGPPQVIVVYPPTADLPPSPVAGVGALLSTTPGYVDSTFFVKYVDAGTVVEAVDVQTASGDVVAGIWLGGTPHVYVIDREGDGVRTTDTLRLATNTLLWQVGGTVFRFESELDRDAALAVAATVVDANAPSG